MKQKKKYILPAIGIILILIQFIRIDKTNPPVDPQLDFMETAAVAPSGEIKKMLQVACYDCHSHQTSYPWYTNIAPVSWWIKGHINGGREHLNFSTWASYPEKKQAHKIEECVEVLEKKWMPMAMYTWLHSDARLSDGDREQLINYFKSLQ